MADEQSNAPTQEEQRRSQMQKILTRSFERNGPNAEVRQRRGGGGRMLDYIATPSAIHRLDEATGGEWDFELEWPPLIVDTYQNEYTDKNTGEVRGGKNDPVKTLVVGAHLSLPGLGRRGAMGVTNIVEGAGEDNLKGAGSDALKKCATLFGVALDLYEDAPPPVGKVREATATGENTQQRHPSNGPTDPQWRKFNALIEKHSLNAQALAKYAAGYGTKQLNVGGMSKCIDMLVKIDNGQMQVPDEVRQDVPRKPQQPQESYYEGGGSPDPQYEHSVPQEQPQRSQRQGGGTDVKANWLRNIKNAKSSQQLDKIYEGLMQADLDGDEDLLQAMSQREEEFATGATYDG